MEWLLAERYITGKSNGAGHFALIVLTQKGFSVLKEIPRSVVHEPSVLQNKSLGALMRAATIEKSVGVVLETLVKAMIGAAMASG
jgi:predicted ATPase